MRLRNVPGSQEHIAASPYCETEPEKRKGSWQAFFGQEAPLYLEIGCGKGRFLAEHAGRSPQINYLGIEKYTNVLVKAVQKQEALLYPNLRFARMDAEVLEEVFAPGEVARIYLNFSDPWPKARHANRRLPSAAFLRRYGHILVPGGEVEFKTDDTALFDFALEELPRAEWEAEEICRDLHAREDLLADNCMTEYETRFVGMGKPICYLKMHRKRGDI
jgi:tRNA (guanine-N7-)-methyltransferase